MTASIDHICRHSYDLTTPQVLFSEGPRRLPSRRSGMAENVGKRVGQRIRELRQKAGLSQARLAERLGSGVAVETVSRFERGAQVPTFEWVARISVALGTDLDGFLGGFRAEGAVPDPEIERVVELLSGLSEGQLTHAVAVLRAHLAGVDAASRAKGEAAAT